MNAGSTAHISSAKNVTGQVEIAEAKLKVLCITRDSNADTLEIDLGKVGKNIGDAEQVTKRGILGTLACLFDPNGIASPLTVVAKILFQVCT